VVDIEAIKATLVQWCKGEPCIVRAYIFGSRARDDYRSDSDLDIALQLADSSTTSTGLATWIEKHEIWEHQLAALLPHVVHLRPVDEDTPAHIKAAIEAGILAYERSS
jgi:predicted nucleotidyltransferase